MTTRETLAVNYWQVAHPTAVTFFGDVVSTHLFGKKSCDLKRLSLLHDLQFYLDIMEQNKELDVSQNVTGIDYNALYCIETIKKQLRCAGIDNKVINDLIALYTVPIASIPPGSNNQGIGFMAIEGTTNPFHVSPN